MTKKKTVRFFLLHVLSSVLKTIKSISYVQSKSKEIFNWNRPAGKRIRQMRRQTENFTLLNTPYTGFLFLPGPFQQVPCWAFDLIFLQFLRKPTHNVVNPQRFLEMHVLPVASCWYRWLHLKASMCSVNPLKKDLSI